MFDPMRSGGMYTDRNGAVYPDPLGKLSHAEAEARIQEQFERHSRDAALRAWDGSSPAHSGGYPSHPAPDDSATYARQYLASALDVATRVMEGKGERACEVVALPDFTPPAPAASPVGPPSSPTFAPSEPTMSYFDHTGKTRTFYAATLSEYGEIVVQPYQDTGHGYDYVSLDGRTVRLAKSSLCDTSEEALNRLRTSVGLAKLVLPREKQEDARLDREALLAAWRTEAYQQLRTELRSQVITELRTELAPTGFTYSDMARTYVPTASLVTTTPSRSASLSEPKENLTMTTTPSSSLAPQTDAFGKMAEIASKVSENVKVDGRAAALRSVCRQLVGMGQVAAVALLKEHKVAAPTRTAFANFLKTDLGLALLGGTIGSVMPMVPQLAAMPIAMEVAREMRVEAGSRGFDKVLGASVKRFLPEAISALGSLESFGITDRG